MSALRKFSPSPLVAMTAIAASLVCWHLAGELRWRFRPWHLQLNRSDRAVIFGSMDTLQLLAAGLALFAVVWMTLVVAKKRSRWRIVGLVVSVVGLALAFVP